MTGTFDAKRSDGITDALPGYLFEQRTQICRADVGMSCDIIQAQGVGFKSPVSRFISYKNFRIRPKRE